ncbi:hypothetical protein [Pseudomonas sp. LB3P31]
MARKSTNQASIDQLRQEMAAVAEEMSRPTPTAGRAFLFPFSMGAVFALTTFVVAALVTKLF